MKSVSNLAKPTKFQTIPEHFTIIGLNFGNGPWRVERDDIVLGEFSELAEAERFCWYEQGRSDGAKK